MDNPYFDHELQAYKDQVIELSLELYGCNLYAEVSNVSTVYAYSKGVSVSDYVYRVARNLGFTHSELL
jgi:hypothetical protein